MRSFLAVLAFCGAVGLLWWGTPAIDVWYQNPLVALYDHQCTWCIQSDNLHIWDSLPPSVFYEPVGPDPDREWPLLKDVRVEASLHMTRDTVLSLAAARRFWLAMTAGQAALLALLLARHRRLGRNGRRLAGWCRRRLVPEILVVLILAAACAILALLTFLGPFVGPDCISQQVTVAEYESLLATLAGIDVTLPQPVTPTMIRPAIGFTLLSWGSLALSALLLLLSLAPLPGAVQGEAVAAKDATP